MLSSLCPVMAAIPSVSHFWGASGGPGSIPQGGGPGPAPDKIVVIAVGPATGRGDRPRLILGFHAASWQHRYLDCGTLFLSGRCGRGTPCRGRRQVAARKEPPVAGACMVGGCSVER